MLTFRNLRPAEATPALFAGFIRRQVVVDCWRWENGGWTIRPDPFIDDWSAADIAALAAGLRRTLAAGGFVRAAFCGAQLKGFAAAAAQPCGAQGEYIDLLELHVSADWRGRGAGTALFAAAAAWARGGYDVIVDGIVGPWFLEPWRALAREGYEVHYIVLRAGKEETMRRAVQRAKLDRKTNIELVETMWEQFCGLGRYEAHVIDTTTCSVQETVSAIQEKIASGTAVLS